MSGFVGGPGRGRPEEAVYVDIERALPHLEESCRQFLALTNAYDRAEEWRSIRDTQDTIAAAVDLTAITPALDELVDATDRLIARARGDQGVEVAGATLARNALALKGFVRELAALA